MICRVAGWLTGHPAGGRQPGFLLQRGLASTDRAPRLADLFCSLAGSLKNRTGALKTGPGLNLIL